MWEIGIPAGVPRCDGPRPLPRQQGLAFRIREIVHEPGHNPGWVLRLQREEEAPLQVF